MNRKELNVVGYVDIIFLTSILLICEHKTQDVKNNKLVLETIKVLDMRFSA